MSKRFTITLICFFVLNEFAAAQQKWSLLKCVQYALDSNISVKQSEVQERLAAIDYKQSKLSIYPSGNFTNNEGYRFGRSQNPSTGILESQNFFTVGLSLQTNVDI